MVGEVMNLFRNIFSTCLAWFWQTLEAIDGLDWVLAALIFVAVVSLLLMPLRGGRTIDTSPIRDFSVPNAVRSSRRRSAEKATAEFRDRQKKHYDVQDSWYRSHSK